MIEGKLNTTDSDTWMRAGLSQEEDVLEDFYAAGGALGRLGDLPTLTYRYRLSKNFEGEDLLAGHFEDGLVSVSFDQGGFTLSKSRVEVDEGDGSAQRFVPLGAWKVDYYDLLTGEHVSLERPVGAQNANVVLEYYSRIPTLVYDASGFVANTRGGDLIKPEVYFADEGEGVQIRERLSGGGVAVADVNYIGDAACLIRRATYDGDGGIRGRIDYFGHTSDFSPERGLPSLIVRRSWDEAGVLRVVECYSAASDVEMRFDGGGTLVPKGTQLIEHRYRKPDGLMGLDREIPIRSLASLCALPRAPLPNEVEASGVPAVNAGGVQEGSQAGIGPGYVGPIVCVLLFFLAAVLVGRRARS